MQLMKGYQMIVCHRADVVELDIKGPPWLSRHIRISDA